MPGLLSFLPPLSGGAVLIKLSAQGPALEGWHNNDGVAEDFLTHAETTLTWICELDPLPKCVQNGLKWNEFTIVGISLASWPRLPMTS